MKEVYIAKGIDGEILYVGQGNIGRNSHCLNGTSHNKHLNRYFFSNGENGCITTEVVHIVSTQEEALELEKNLIKALDPTYNLCRYDGNNDAGLSKNKTTNFQKYAKLLYDTKAEDQEVKDLVFSAYPSMKEYLNTMGIDEFRTCGFQESKLKKKFLLVVGAKELESNRSAVREVFRLKNGEWYSLKDIKSKLTKSYKQLGFQNKAFASDVSKFYVTKRSKRNGVEGVVVLDIV